MSPTGHQLLARLAAVSGACPGPHSDGRYVEARTPSCVDAEGHPIPLEGDDRLRSAWFRGIHVTRGIRIVAEKPVKSEPEPLVGPVGSTILLDGGRYRSWDGANVSGSEDACDWRPVLVPGEPKNTDRNSPPSSGQGFTVRAFLSIRWRRLRNATKWFLERTRQRTRGFSPADGGRTPSRTTGRCRPELYSSRACRWALRSYFAGWSRLAAA